MVSIYQLIPQQFVFFLVEDIAVGHLQEGIFCKSVADFVFRIMFFQVDHLRVRYMLLRKAKKSRHPEGLDGSYLIYKQNKHSETYLSL